MAIGTTAAIIGAGVLGAGGAILAGSQNAKAIGQASDAQAQAAREATQLQREARDQNVAYQTPWMNTGLTANAHMNALLGLSVPQSTQQHDPAIPASGSQTGQIPNSGNYFQNIVREAVVRRWQQRIANGEATLEEAPLAVRNVLSPPQQNPVAGQTPATNITQPSAEAAYNAFKNYTGYTSRLNEGQNAINSGYAAKGTLQSGAALQALQEHGQDYASREFMNYMGLLGGQQQVGVGATNALSGIGTNYANAAGNLAINQGNNAANAAIARANNTGSMIQGVGGALGGMLGGLAFPGSSYSDRRLKKDIVEVRKRSDGLTVFEWTYRNDPDQRRYQGFMADEVKDIYPAAYIENFNGTGYEGVNYAEIPHESKLAA